MGKLGFYFDMTACIGCRTCQIACKDKKDLPIGIFFRQVRSFEVGEYPDPQGFNYSSTCNHCDDPACVMQCPTGSMHISDIGIVEHDDDTCIGCRICVSVCPYEVPQFVAEKRIVQKCDACRDLLDEHLNPACVDACVMRCLEFGDVDELRSRHPGQELTDHIAILPDSSITSPSLLVNPREAAYRDHPRKLNL